MSRRIIRTYKQYRLKGTAITMMCAVPLEAIYFAAQHFDMAEWELAGVFDVEMVKDREESVRQEALKGMREIFAAKRQAD